MEIELKYCFKNKEDAERLFEDSELRSWQEQNSEESLQMKSVYFDNEDMDLSKNLMAYRIRVEGERIIGSLKWGGSVEGALHSRQEINVPVNDDTCLISPDPTLFAADTMGAEIPKLLRGKPLIPIVEISLLRKRFRLEYKGSLIELSLDKGEIISDKGNERICEVELELFHGESGILLELGEKLSKKYELLPEKRSKYARGLALIGKI